MASQKNYGIGIVGCGMVAGIHAQAIAGIRGARLVGVASRNEEQVRSFAAKHGAPFSTTRVEELLARPDIDIVCITTPTGAHLEPALAAMRAGKHLIVEKPLEVTVERADTLLQAAAEHGVQVCGVFMARFGKGAQTVKAAIDAGRFGRLVLCSAYVKWLRPPSYYKDSWHGTLKLDGGAVLINQGIHAVDLLQWFAGMPEEVFAWKTRCVHTGIEGEDTLSATLRFPHGALGTIEASTALYPGFSRRLEICGENGSAVLEDDTLTTWKFREAQPGDADILNPPADDSMRSGSSAPNQIGALGHQLQIQDFIDALNEGRPPAVDGVEARKALSLVTAIYASAERHAPVMVAS